MSFATVDAPLPRIDAAEAAGLLARHWGLTGTLTELGSQQDRNLRVDADGDRYVLKISNAGVTQAALEAQHAAVRTLRERLPDLAVPTPVPTRSGASIVTVPLASGEHPVQLLRFVEGTLLDTVGYLAPVTLETVGRLLGQVTAALADLDHPGADHRSQWDLRCTPALVDTLAPRLDRTVRDRVTSTVDAVADRLTALGDDLPQQVCHADAHDGNLVVRRGEDGRAIPVGLIDLGDLVRTWRLADLAIATAAIIRRAPSDPLPIAAALARGFASALPLTNAEVTALWPAIRWRAAGDACATAYGCLLEPDNPYTAANLPTLLRVLDAVRAVPTDLAEESLRAALELPPGPAAASLAPPSSPATAPTTRTPQHHDPHPSAVPAPVTLRRQHGEVIPADGTPAAAPATRHLGVLLGCNLADATVRSPVDGHVRSWSADRLVLAADGGDVVLDGLRSPLRAGAEVARGTPLGRVAATTTTATTATTASADRGPGGIRVVVTAPGLTPPRRVPASAWPGWSRLTLDPASALDLTLLLGPITDPPSDAGGHHVDDAGGNHHPIPDVAARPPLDAAAQLGRRRDRVLARAQQRYYAAPPWIVTGRGAVLTDIEGRSYLDTVNNVAVLGHAHPAVTAAVSSQLTRVNTNSRFLYEPMVTFAERLVARMPDGLDQVLIVTSGSEATELALRLAREATGRRDVLYLDDGYHGWTAAAATVSGELDEVASPLLPGSAFAHPLPAPNRYRGAFRGPDATDRYLDAAVATIERLEAEGRPPAGLIAETLLGNAGGIALPTGYLDRLYAAVRRAGGVCIADEVQVGYGRLGTHLWGFESQQVTPDIVTVAKAAGNGVPIGAVVTRRELAEAYADAAYFFSSAGGSPAACAAGVAVLDTIEREGLQAAALRVGTRLRYRLEALRAAVDDGPVRIGAVHGQGLYLGVELVRDLETREPAGPQARALCERMLTLGVIVQPTSRHGNVLKVKPPLCITEGQADTFVDRLAAALTDGW